MDAEKLMQHSYFLAEYLFCFFCQVLPFSPFLILYFALLVVLSLRRKQLIFEFVKLFKQYMPESFPCIISCNLLNLQNAKNCFNGYIEDYLSRKPVSGGDITVAPESNNSSFIV